VEVNEQYQVKISNGFVTSENLDDNVDISEIWESSKENIKTSSRESRLL
jgi:hypothetical protein